MKVSYNWLKEILQFDLSPQQVAEALTGAGFPVEEITPLAETLEGVVVAELLEVRPHPNADRLSLTKVSDGVDTYSVVCGAKNIAPGNRVPLAKIGAVLPGNFKIKRSKIRGEVSEGMLCSASELQLEIIQEDDGILRLPPDSQLGQPLAQCLGLDDVVLDIELTANRGDLLSIRGLAAELSAVLGKPFALPEPPAVQGEESGISVRIETEACYRYTGRMLRDVKVQPSPLSLQLRLLACGMRPVNNIVDITNLVMLEWGQPLHAFDADKLPAPEITVRQARPGETMVTLDGKERKLESRMMLITSGDRPVAIAGVMGSLDSEVDENTSNILLESAGFDPVSVRITSKALGISSEAGNRYEKGVDPAVITTASHRAAALIRDLAGGRVGNLVGAGSEAVEKWTVEADLTDINSLLGTEISRERAAELLTNLGLEVGGAGEQLLVNCTPRRRDLRVWQDIAEEVGRLQGLDNIPATLPHGPLTLGARKPHQQLEWQIRDILCGCGLHETVAYSFISPEMTERTKAAAGVTISNPLTRERSVMRGEMLPSLLETVAYNLAHGLQSVAIFELGNIYWSDSGQTLPYQAKRVAGALAGSTPGHWQQEAKAYNFYHVKGIVEELLAGLNLTAQFERAVREQFHPGRCAQVSIDGVHAGYLGQVHPAIAAGWKLDGEVWAFDLDFQVLAAAVSGQRDFRAPSRYPAIRRDLAVETDLATEAGCLLAIIKEEGGELLEAVDCFDVYSGPNLGADRKSLAFALSFRHRERTLKDREVQALLDKIIARLEQAGAFLRG